MQRRLLIVTLIALLVSACDMPPATATPLPVAETAAPTAHPTSTPKPTDAPTATPTLEPSATPIPVYGPEDYPENINPLTGLVVDDPTVLDRAPLLIMVSNESPEVRPQSGLAYADHVWEYQMEGFRQTRYTAVIYSQSPERVGSVRSVRLINTDHLRTAYDGLIVTSGASVGIYQVLQYGGFWEKVFREEENRDHLMRIRDIPRPFTDFYHGLFAIPENVWEYADERGVNTAPDLAGMSFSESIPEGGTPTTDVIADMPDNGPIHRWHYDEESGAWLSFTTDPRAMAAEAPDFDMLTDEQLAFDNVVVIFAEHALSEIFEDGELSAVEVNLIGEGDAVLLRDGLRYEVTWQRGEETMFRLVDSDGEAVPFKPGQTWFMVVSNNIYMPEVRFNPEP